MLQHKVFFIVFTMLGMMCAAEAKPLSQTEIYTHCFKQLTNSSPNTSSQTFIDVAAGNKDAVEACLEIIDGAAISNTSHQIADPNDTQAKQTLAQMHDFHASWTQNKLIQFPGACFTITTPEIYDFSALGLYMTRALFNPDINIDSVFQGNVQLEPIRTNMTSATSPLVGKPLSEFTYVDTQLQIQPWSQLLFAGSGDLLGAGPARSVILPNGNVLDDVPQANKDIQKSLGGGILGNHLYFLQTVNEALDFNSDGAVELPRNWSKSVLEELLCRDLPSVREGDTTAHIVKDPNAAAFRQFNSCLACHSSMDQMAGAARNVRYMISNTCIGGSPIFNGTPHMYETAVTQPPGDTWEAFADPNFHKRPPDGRLFYRSYDGSLINKKVRGLEALGAAILETNDFYVCAAKRYFRHFTGISVNLADSGDSNNPLNLTKVQQEQRDEVIKLGLALKNHKDPRQLVKEIIESVYFQDSEGGASVGGSQ